MPEKTVAPRPAPRVPDLPKQDLSKIVLYQFLLAEIAHQRGEIELSSKAYAELTKSTGDPRIAQRAVQLALQARMPAAALEAAQAWLKEDPGSPEAKQAIVYLLITQNRLGESKDYLDKLLAENPSIGFLQLNGLFPKTADKAAVLSLVQELAKPYPQLPEAHLALAQAAWGANSQDLALTEARTAISLRPDWDLAALFQGVLLRRQSSKATLDYFQGYLKAHPKARDVRLSYARELVASKNYAAARVEFQQLLTEFPNNQEVLFAVALLSLQVKDYDTAEKYFNTLLQADYKDEGSIRFYLGQLNEERKRYDDASRWYNSVEPGEQYLLAQIKVATMLAKQNKLDEARKYLNQIPVETTEQRVQVTLAESTLLRDASAYQESFDLLGRALDKLPNNPELLYDHAMAAEKLGRIDVLELDLHKLIQLQPDHAHAYNALGYTLADRTDRIKEAIGYIEQALKLSPDDPFIMDSMGWAQYRLGNLDSGINYLRKAYSDRPDPEIAVHLGEVLWAQGKRQEASSLWQASLKDNPENVELLKVIQKYKQ